MKLLNGKIIKKQKLELLKEQLLVLNEKVSLAVIEIGNDDASKVYLKQKETMANQVGLDFKMFNLDKNVKTSEVLSLIDKLNSDRNINGMILQMPIPSFLDKTLIINRINPIKDVDGLTDINAGKLMHGKEDALAPATSLSVIDILKYYNIKISGKHAVILGRSDLVGKPLINLLLNENASVSVCHSKSENIKDITKKADILIVATGKANLINKDYINPNSTLIDVGISLVDGKITGDIDFESVKDSCFAITPVPGGVGQLTVANIGFNTLKAYNLQKRLK